MDQNIANQNICEVIKNRKSYRAFLKKDVELSLIEEILETARWAPSSTNMQPWEVVVVSGKKKIELDQLLVSAFDKNQSQQPDMTAYMDVWEEPFKSRRKECGLQLYKALNITRDDKDGMRKQIVNNFKAFDAPMVIYLLTGSDLKTGSIFDCGLFLQTVMLAARSKGLETCPQATLVAYAEEVKNLLKIERGKLLLCGLAVGYADYKHEANSYRTERAEVNQFAKFIS